MNKFLVVLRKELTEALRDRRALCMLLLFITLYPAMLWLTVHKTLERSAKSDKEAMEIVVIGGDRAPTLLAQIGQRNVTAALRDDMSENEITELLRTRKHAAVIRIPEEFEENYRAMRPAPIELWYDSAADQQIAKLRRLEALLRNYNAGIAQSRLLAHGVSPATLVPIRLQEYDIASSASRSAGFAGVMLGLFFATAFFFSMNTAMDSTAGERERNSLELLMAQPVRPLELIAGKWIAAAALSVVGLTVELLIAHFILKWMPLEEIGMSWSLSVPMLLAVCLTSIPLCLFAAALEIALAMNARSFKEAQALMTFAILIPMLPPIIVPLLDLKTASWMYAVPVLSNQTLLNELAKGQNLGPLPFLLTAGGAIVAAILAVGVATWRLRSERYVLAV
ncbi:MAG TPA: ABC transporter permease [Paucimonas sp.]|nr:ABC transporter permease [Paucimonas sp.]